MMIKTKKAKSKDIVPQKLAIEVLNSFIRLLR